MSGVDLLIEGATVVTGRAEGLVYPNADIAVAGENIVEIGPNLAPEQVARRVDELERRGRQDR